MASSRLLHILLSPLPASSSFLRLLPLASALSALAASLLPPASRFLLPLLHSAFLVSLPRLWHSLLRWITPPCLFVLLNGIIMTLTVTSGILSGSSAGGSEFYANFLRMETVQKQSALESPVKQRLAKLSKRLFLDTPVKQRFTEKLADEEDKRVQEKEVEVTPLQLALDDRASYIENTLDVSDSEFNGASSGSSNWSKPEEFASEESETQQLRSIRRSQSLDSAVVREIVEYKRASSSSMIVVKFPPLDDLTDEDLKKRMDDFISRETARIRNESLKAN